MSRRFASWHVAATIRMKLRKQYGGVSARLLVFAGMQIPDRGRSQTDDFADGCVRHA